MTTTLVLAVLLTVVGAGQAQTPGGDNVAGEIEQLTRSLVEVSTRAQQAEPARRAELESDARELAGRRRDLLQRLVQQSPQQALSLTMPADTAEKLPPGAKVLVETDADEQGVLEVLVEDYPESHRTLYFLHTKRERLQLHFVEPPSLRLESGAQVRARGKRLDSSLVVAPNSASEPAGTGTAGLQVLALASSNTFGAQPTAVILVNFQDNSSQPYTAEQARTVVFDTTSNFDRENSQNQTWLTGDVFGWFPIALSKSVCDYNKLATLASQAATNAGAVLSSYKRIVYGFPQNACGWWGLGTIGGSTSRAWINGRFELLVVAHEMGHNFGLYHSHALNCSGSTLGGSCTSLEYGDMFDTMGNYTASHFNAFQKERLGWLNYGSSLPITTVSSSGTYTLLPYSTSGPGSRALRVPKGTDPSTGARTWYYIEYRQPVGFDSGLTRYPTSTAGFVIHMGTEGSADSSFLLDLNPQTSSFSDAALPLGASFTDAAAGVTIATAWANGTDAGVTITLGTSSACTRANPVVSISPAAAAAVAAGATVSYSITLRSADSSSCDPATFNLAASARSGWSANFGNPALTLAPGASSSTVLQVTSPSATVNGVYGVSVTATNAANTARAASATATYTVSNPSSSRTFSLSISPANVSIRQGYTGYVTVTSSVSGGFSSGVSLSLTGVPTGLTVTLYPTYLPAPGSGSTRATIRVASTKPVGTYSFTVRGTGGGLTRTTVISFSVTSSTTTGVVSIPQTLWKLRAVDSQETSCGDFRGLKAFDGNNSTMWVTQYCGANPPAPHEIQIDLGMSYLLAGFRYVPRQDGNPNGKIKSYAFYISSDGVTWTTVATGTLIINPADLAAKQVFFNPIYGRYVRLRALSEVNNNPWTTMAELNVYRK